MGDERLLTPFEASKILEAHWKQFEPAIRRNILYLGDHSGVTSVSGDPSLVQMTDQSGNLVRVKKGNINVNAPAGTPFFVGPVLGNADSYPQAYDVAAVQISGYAGQNYGVSQWVGISMVGFGDPTTGNLKGDSHLLYDSVNQTFDLYSDGGPVFHFHSYGNRGSFTGTMANGTQASPTKTLSGDEMRRDSVFGWEEVTPGETNNSVTRIRTFATENYTDTATGARLVFETTPNGTNSPTPALTLGQDQSATLGGAFVPAKEITPAALVADVNDYAPTGVGSARMIRVSGTAARNVTGLLAGLSGEEKIIWNVGAFNITLKNSDAGSSAANRFQLKADIVLAQYGGAQIRYDATLANWIAIGVY